MENCNSVKIVATLCKHITGVIFIAGIFAVFGGIIILLVNITTDSTLFKDCCNDISRADYVLYSLLTLLFGLIGIEKELSNDESRKESDEN
jgi:hypothetical protein